MPSHSLCAHLDLYATDAQTVDFQYFTIIDHQGRVILSRERASIHDDLLINLRPRPHGVCTIKAKGQGATFQKRWSKLKDKGAIQL